jgi:hypothetical protein
MPDFTITISDAAVTRLQSLTQKHNDQTGESLTVKQWIVFTLRLAAVREELAANSGTIWKQMEETQKAERLTALQAEQDRLMGTV